MHLNDFRLGDFITDDLNPESELVSELKLLESGMRELCPVL